MYEAKEIAAEVIRIAKEIDDFSMSNLKLQKVLYFLQANHLVHNKRRLFADRIEAVDFGPIVWDVYMQYRAHGGLHLLYTNPDTVAFPVDKDTSLEIRKTIEEMREYSSTTLLDLIHHQDPWINAYYDDGWVDRKTGKVIKEITPESLYIYFKEA